MIPHSGPWLTGDDYAAVRQCLESGQVASGGLARRFEESVEGFVGAAAARSTADGTTGLTAGLRLLGVGAGDDVVLPTYVCSDVERSVRAVGAAPRFADVGADATITADTVACAMTPRTRAIIAVHVFGHPCAIAPLKAFGVPILEDACQAFGFETPEGCAGTLGDAGVYSFHATKCLTTGEGGMLVTRSAELGVSEISAECPPISDLQASLGLAQLARYDRFLARRREIRATYETALRQRGSTTRRPPGDLFRFTFSLRSGTSFDAAAEHFARLGISLRRGVDALLHRAHGLSDDGFPGASGLFARTASVPFYPSLSNDEVAAIATAITEYDCVA